jgi:YVTN family beta-propeller protein
VFLRDLGLWRLKDVDRPERIAQVAAEGLRTEFPPLRGAERVKERPVLRRRSVLAAALVGVIAAAVAIPVFAVSSGGSGGSEALAGVGANAVGEVDSSTGRITASAPVGASPGAVAVGEGSVWVVNTSDNSVSRIDPKTHTVEQTITVGHGPSGIAVGSGFVWVANSLNRSVSKIDPNTNGGRVIDRIPVGNGPAGVAFSAGAVWVANSADGTVVRIDPRTDRTSAPIPVEAGAYGVAVGDGSVWVTSGRPAGSVSRIDPRAMGVVQVLPVGNGPGSVAVGDGSVWVVNSLDGTVSRIDPGSNSEKARIPVGDGPSGVAVTASDGVWVSDEFGGNLSQIDPDTNTVVKTVKTGNRPQGIAANGALIYTAVRGSSTLHRGGTLRIAGAGPNTLPAGVWIDPVDIADWSLSILTNDGLTGFDHVAGVEGTRLVPDLATSLPAPTDGGRTYTFQLRRGIRYSDGTPVRPADFRRALERSIADPGSVARGFLTAISGAAACVKTPKHCDLSNGIVADNNANTVTFHLTTPDPDFLYKLALPFASAIPSDTPLMKARLPLPATGPYKIGSFDPKRGITYVRNPYFREWSQAAQPQGFPNEIVLRFGYADEVRAVEQGRADFALDGVPNTELNDVNNGSLARYTPTRSSASPSSRSTRGCPRSTT